jgi:hypothetical protein
MTTRRSYGFAALLAATGVALAGCGTAEGAAPTPAKVASVVTPLDGGPGTVTLADAAVRRLGIQTATVAAGRGGLTVPYGALVYEADGSAWVFIQTAPRAYRRAAIAVTGITGNTVTLKSGPTAGTRVVTVGAAELVGVEIGIDGEQ